MNRVVFLHLKKSGGEALHQATQKVAECYRCDHKHRLDPPATAVFVQGELPLATFIEKGVEGRFFTILRDPGDRWLSMIYWARRNKRMRDPDWEETKHEVRLARYDPQRYLDEFVIDGVLKDRVMNAPEKLSHIGHFPNLEPTAQWLSNQLGVKVLLEDVNHNPDKEPRLQDEEGFRQEARKRCPNDMEVYERSQDQGTYLCTW